MTGLQSVRRDDTILWVLRAHLIVFFGLSAAVEAARGAMFTAVPAAAGCLIGLWFLGRELRAIRTAGSRVVFAALEGAASAAALYGLIRTAVSHWM